MKRFLPMGLLIGTLFLSGCHSYVSSLKNTFRQAEIVAEEDLYEARTCIKQGPVYDYFNTITTMSMLWVNPTVSATLAALTAVDSNFAEVPNALDSARFIVLMDGEKNDWLFTLHVGQNVYRPILYKAFTLTQGYATIFGPKLMRHKRNVYELVFPIKNLVRPFSIRYSNGTYRQMISWEEEKTCAA